jgi:hypothetical protein
VRGWAAAPVLALDDDLQSEARLVASRTPDPQGPLEVAVVLETLGYTDEQARRLGRADVFALAKDVFEAMEDFGHLRRPPAPDPEPRPPAGVVPHLGLGLWYSVPWLAALGVLAATGSSFWSSAADDRALASGLVAALFVSLVVTGPFVQAFARRATFYLLQGRRAMAGWCARVLLGGGAAVAAGALGTCYLVLERALGAWTPGATRSMLAVGLAISWLQLALAPLYVTRALAWLGASVSLGVAVLVVGLRAAGAQGPFPDPFAVVRVQLAALATMAAVATLGGWWRLRGDGGGPAPRPRPWALARGLGPYAAFGAGYSLLVVADHLVAGGLAHGRFLYDLGYETVVGACLLVLVPAFAYVVAASEALARLVERQLDAVTVATLGALGAAVRSWWRRRLAGLGLVVLAGSGALGAFAALGRPDPVAARLADHPLAVAGALAACGALALGVLNAQLCFALSRPAGPAAGALGGAGASLAAGALASGWAHSPYASVAGLVCGCLVLGASAAWSARRALARFDASYYGAL